MDTNDNLVLGAAFNYGPDQIRPFVHSLRRSYAGRIALLVSQVTPELDAFFQHYGVEPVVVAEQIDFRWINVNRFRMYHEYLSRTPCDRVLLCDVRDLVFQADPFTARPTASLVFCSEPELIGNCAINAKWYGDLLGAQELDKVRGKNILCGGTIYGNRQSILNFIAIFWSEFTKLIGQGRGFGQCDQALMNYLAYNVLQDWTRFDTWSSDVATLFHTRLLTFNRAGELVNPDGSLIPIVHQYDRIGPFIHHFVGRAVAGDVPSRARAGELQAA